MNDFRRNPLDFSAYERPTKAIKEALEVKKLSFNDYIYDMAAKNTIFDYIL